MPNFTEIASRIYRQLLGIHPDARSDEAGVTTLLEGVTAIAVVEAILSENASSGESFPPEAGAIAWRGEQQRQQINLFGKPLLQIENESPRAALANAMGLTMSGKRTTCSLWSNDLASAQDLVRRAVGHHLPLVIHTINRAQPLQGTGIEGDHQAIHQLRDSGALILLAENVQQAVDFTLIAHAVAEQTLVPAIVVMDGQETAFSLQKLQLPSAQLIQQIVGDSSEPITIHDPAQRLLFGEQRRRIPCWHDLDHPALHGAHQDEQSYGLGEIAHTQFFGKTVMAALKQGFIRFDEATGRKYGPLSLHGKSSSRRLLITQGAVTERCHAAVEHIKKQSRRKLTVISLHTLAPFPTAELRQWVQRADEITLLERVEPLLDERPPLYQQIAAIASPSCRLHSLLYGSGGMPLRSADLIAACQLTPQSPAHPLHLGAAPFSRSNNPKQQVQHDLLERHYPMLGQCSQHGSHSDHFLQPEGTISVAVVHRNHPSHHPLCWQLAEQLYQATGEEVRAESQSPHTSDWGYSRIDCLSHSPHPLPSLDPESPLDLLIVVGHTPQQGIPALERLKRGGALLIDPAELGYDHYISALPVENFRQLQQREILLYTVTPDASTPQLIGHCFSLIGQIAEIDLRESRLVSAYRPQQDREQFQQALAPMQPHTLPSAQESVSPLLPTTPVAVRHLAQMEMESHAGYQSLSRFWDQTGVLYRDGEADQQGITPFGATGGVPPLTATFSNHTSQRETLPHFDPALCSGCGACWSYCPDSAIGATSLTPAQLLETALQMGGADALRPHLSKLAKQLSLLSESGNAATLIQQGWDALMAQAPLAETRRASAEAALATVISNLEQLPLAHTEPLFHQREQQKPQAGELLTVVINPDSCKGCGLCTTLCSEEASRQEQEQAALTLAPQQPTSISLAYQQWRVWEQLPDSASSTLIEYASRPEIGPLRATLLSRYAAMAVSGGDSAEPGSGEKLVVRQLLAITEYRQQPLVHQLIQLLDEHYEQLMGGIREQLAAASHVDDLAALAEGLGDLTNRQITLTTLAEKTTNIESSGIDAFALKEWIDLAESISEQRQQISSGSQSLGRARYSLAFANGTASGWAGSFPLNPFQVPVVIGDSAEIGAFASGLLSGQLEQATECHRLLHQAKNLLKGGAIAERKAMKQLVWHNLSAEEQQQCPPLLLIGNDTTLGAVSAGGVSWLLNSALPVKIIVLAEMDLGFAGEAGLHGSYHTHADARAELALSALAQRNAYVAQSSLAHPNHLNQSMREALHHPGPALLRIHAPSPQRHGFAPEQTLIQAARIVAGRAFPLFRYNPQRSGVFGTRITLEGNPDEVTSVAHWAYYERRFRGLFHPISSEDLAPTPLLEWLSLDQRGQDSKTPTISEENMEVAIDLPFARRMGQLLDQWQMLQELAGVVTPFTEQVKQEVESAVAANHQAELDALRESHQQALQALREQLEGEVSQRITSRLSALVERSTPTTLV